MSREPARKTRQRINEILEVGIGHDAVANFVNRTLVVLIILNVIAFAAGTIPELAAKYGTFFEAFNLFSILIFTAEYLLRLWACVELPFLGHFSPFRARVYFAARPLMIIDLLAILPFYLSFIVPIDLRYLRIFRLLRFFKLLRYSTALNTVVRVIASERRALVAALVVMLTLIFFASTGIYLLERKAQPDAFGSVPAAAWWALSTLTTVGYGDVVPITAYGKLFGGLVMIFGLGMFALPIGILAAGFSRDANRHDFVVTWNLVARVPLFAGLDAADVAEVMRLLYARSYNPNTPVIRKGDTATTMFFIAAGRVRVKTGDEDVFLGSGAFFGEMALLENRIHRHTVIAVEHCRLLLLDRDDFEHIGIRFPTILEDVRAVARNRLEASAKAN